MSIKAELFAHAVTYLLDRIDKWTTRDKQGRIHPAGALINQLGCLLAPVGNQFDRLVLQPAQRKWKEIETRHFKPIWERIDSAVVRPATKKYVIFDQRVIQPLSKQAGHIQETYIQPTWKRIDVAVIQPVFEKLNKTVIEPANRKIAEIQKKLQPATDKINQIADEGLKALVKINEEAVVPTLGYVKERVIVLHKAARKSLEERSKPGERIDLTVAHHVAIPLSLVVIPFNATLLKGRGENGMLSTALTAGALYHTFVRFMLPRTLSYKGYDLFLGGSNFMFFRATPFAPPAVEAQEIKKGFFPDEHTNRQALYTHWVAVAVLGRATDTLTLGKMTPFVHGTTAFLAVYPPAQEAVLNNPLVKRVSGSIEQAIGVTQRFAIDEIDLAVQAFFDTLAKMEAKEIERGLKPSGFEKFLFAARKQLKGIVDEIDTVLKPTQPEEIAKLIETHLKKGVGQVKDKTLQIFPKRIKTGATPYIESFFDVFGNYHAKQVSHFAITLRGGVKHAPTRLFAMAVVAIATQIIIMRFERKYFNSNLWTDVTQHSPIGAVAFVLAGGKEQTVGEVAVRTFGAYVMMRSSRNRGLSMLMLSTMINYGLSLYRESILMKKEAERKANGQPDSNIEDPSEAPPTSLILSTLTTANKQIQSMQQTATTVVDGARHALVGTGVGEDRSHLVRVFNPLTMEYEDIDPVNN